MKEEHFFYFTDKTIQEKVTLKGVGLFGEDELWEFNKLWDFKADFYGLDTLKNMGLVMKVYSFLLPLSLS